jgi:hypothetical protein
MWLKKVHVIRLIPREINISRNGGKGVVNHIMGFSAFVTMSAT